MAERKRPGGQKQWLTNLPLVLTESEGWADTDYIHSCGTPILIKEIVQLGAGQSVPIPYCPKCEEEPVAEPVEDLSYWQDLSDQVAELVHKTVLRLSRQRDDTLEQLLKNAELLLQRHPAFTSYLDYQYHYDFTSKLVKMRDLITTLSTGTLAKIDNITLAPPDLLTMLYDKLQSIWSQQELVTAKS